MSKASQSKTIFLLHAQEGHKDKSQGVGGAGSVLRVEGESVCLCSSPGTTLTPWLQAPSLTLSSPHSYYGLWSFCLPFVRASGLPWGPPCTPGWSPHLQSLITPTKALCCSRRHSHKIQILGHSELWGCHYCPLNSLFSRLYCSVLLVIVVSQLELYTVPSFTNSQSLLWIPTSLLPFWHVLCPLFW